LSKDAWRLWHQGLRDRRRSRTRHRHSDRAPVRRMNCLTPLRYSTAYQTCRLGWWPIAAIPVTASASTSGAAGRDWGPAKSNEAPVACPDWIYNNPNVVERL
jgi:hypothetical protein